MNPYDELDVPQDAPPEAIKRAYRAKAKRTHPDSPAGDREAFERANKAWLVLSDPGKRERFDKTGSVDDGPENAMGILASLMGNALEEAIQAVQGRVEKFDLVEIMLASSRDKLVGVKAEIEKGTKALKRTDSMIERISYKGAGQNLLAGILKDKRRGLAEQVQHLERTREAFESLIAVLADYGWRVDEADQQIDLEDFLRGPVVRQEFYSASANT